MDGRTLANAAMISPGHLSLIERNLRNPSPQVAGRIAAVLDVAIVDLRE